MLRSTKELLGYTLQTTDGTQGKISDFYFDDRGWVLRYVVVDTGTWLPGRLVLVSPLAFGEPDWRTRLVPVLLSREQVENAPSIRIDEPVSRQHEEALAAYYQWAPYWGPVPAPPEGQASAESEGASAGDPHLRSVKEVTGYHIHAIGGDIGHVEDFIAETEQWKLRYMVVDTRNWLPGRKVLVSPDWIAAVRWADEAVDVELSREAIKDSPPFDPHTPVNRDYEVRLYDFYGRPRYWE